MPSVPAVTERQIEAGPATGLEPFQPVIIESTSATERASFRKCRRQWFLGVVHRLGRPSTSPDHFWVGQMFHAGLQGFYESLRDGASMEDAADGGMGAALNHYDKSLEDPKRELGWLFSTAEGAFELERDLVMEMLRGYFARELREPADWKVRDVEVRVEVPIRNAAGRQVGRLSCQFDLVVERPDGRVAIVDHKTASREHSSPQLDIDDQLTAYCWAYWKAYGEFPYEEVYNVAMKKVPEQPKRLKPDKKTGEVKLSKDKNQPTTYELYVEAIREEELDLNDYSDILQELRHREDQFFRRESVFRTPGQMAEFERNLAHEWSDMQAVAARPERAYPSPSPFYCPSCPVNPVCRIMMDQGDVETVLKNSYVVKGRRR